MRDAPSWPVIGQLLTFVLSIVFEIAILISDLAKITSKWTIKHGTGYRDILHNFYHSNHQIWHHREFHNNELPIGVIIPLLCATDGSLGSPRVERSSKMVPQDNLVHTGGATWPKYVQTSRTSRGQTLADISVMTAAPLCDWGVTKLANSPFKGGITDYVHELH